ncbi:IS481 family transposase [Cryptosporangium minutisporangium]|uniref:IS481 family transposase n=1 Tax=Cryptosporangium minutisporangium TaxID=113569 RepID=A0ABP6TDP7_9ACTN
MLARNGLVRAQEQQHKRIYKRWQRETPMHLWQLDLVGGIRLASGRECKMVTGIDDHSRFVVIAAVVAVPSGRAVVAAFLGALRRFGAPFEVLTDNGGQFTGRHIKPQPVEVLFERACRENGINQRLTKPKSPTTTGKIERFHQTLRREFLDHAGPFESTAAAQAAVDAWVQAYNHQRPHQAIGMATPASLFRPHHPSADQQHKVDQAVKTRSVATAADPVQTPLPAGLAGIGVIEPPAAPPSGAAVEFEHRVPPGGEITIVSGKQAVSIGRSLAGQTVTIWADQRSIHVSLHGAVLRTAPSRLTPADLAYLTMRGARPAGPPPAGDALRRRDGRPILEPGHAIEIQRQVQRDGVVRIGGDTHLVGAAWAGRRLTLRLDGHLMHAIADGALVGTWPSPLSPQRAAKLAGATTATSKLPPPPLPAGSIRALRRVHAHGRISVNKQCIKLGKRHVGKLVTVVIEDTHYRVLHNDEEIAVRPRRDTSPITRLHSRGMNTQPG